MTFNMWYVVIINDMFKLWKEEYETFYFQMWIALDASTKPFVKGLAKVKKVGYKNVFYYKQRGY